MVPAHERLHAAQLPAHGVDARLVDDEKLVLLQRRHQALLQFAAVADGFEQFGLEEAVMALARHFHGVHGDIGILQQHFRFGAVAWIQADADRSAHLVAFAAQVKRFVEGDGDALRHLLGTAVVFHRVEHDDEFVAAQAHHVVARPQHGLQTQGGGTQHFISLGVALRVVDILEAVEVGLMPIEAPILWRSLPR